MKIKVMLFMFSFFIPLILFANPATCPLLDGLNVNSSKQILNICKQGIAIKTFKIALGYKGVGKKQAGDNKTPLGLYGLAHPIEISII